MSGVPESCPWGSLSPEQQEYSTFLDGVLGQEARFVKGALELMSRPGGIVSASRREGGVPRLLHTDMVDLDPEIIDQYVPLPPKGDAFAGVVVQAHRFWRRPLPDGQVGIRIRGVGKGPLS